MNKYYSPITNTELIRLDNGFYKSNDDMYYYKIIDGKPLAIKDSNNGGPLVPNSDGTFISKFSNELFHYDNIRDIFIPLYIDIPEIIDETAVVEGNYMVGENTKEKYIIKEDAHIEGNYLVGNQTGRRFLIGDNGLIIPDEYNNYHFDYKNDLTRYIPQRMDLDTDDITEQIIKQGAIENGINLTLVNYLTYLKKNMDKIEKIDIELLFKIMNNQKIDDIILETRLENLKALDTETTTKKV